MEMSKEKRKKSLRGEAQALKRGVAKLNATA